jgi:hypothetical protein
VIAMLAEDDRLKLIKLLGMLGSEHAGERAAAGLKAHELLTARGVTWRELLTPEAAAPAVAVQPRTWRDVAQQVLLDHFAGLFPKEPDFLTSLLERGVAPSERQAAWLSKIAHRCGVPGWEEATT